MDAKETDLMGDVYRFHIIFVVRHVHLKEFVNYLKYDNDHIIYWF